MSSLCFSSVLLVRSDGINRRPVAGLAIQQETKLRARRCISSRKGCSRTRAASAQVEAAPKEVPRLQKAIDDELSNRHIDLDPAGYFLIKTDRDALEIVVEHYTNVINKNGVACDPETGKPIPCTPGKKREPSGIYRGASAKELSVKLLEQQDRQLVTMLVHANYLGREFQRAEAALISGELYIQD